MTTIKTIGKGLAVSLALVGAIGATAATAAPRGDYRGRDNHGDAVVAGIAGLAIGAAIGSSARPNYSYGYSYNPGYRGYYAPPPRYYAPPRAYYGYRDRCRIESRWDPRWGRYVQERVCW